MQCLPSGAVEARRLAARLGVPVHEIDVHRFPDGEIAGDGRRGGADHASSMPRSIARTTSCWRSCSPPRRCGASGARRLVLVAPYLCYMRQDTAFQPAKRSARR